MQYVLNKSISITINKWNINHFEDLGYKDLKINNKIEIPIEHLMINSSIRIDCICDCGNISNITYQKFNMNLNRGGVYRCKECTRITLKESMIYKYNVDNASKSIEINNKRIDTNLKRYGCSYSISSDIVKNTISNNLNIKYGSHYKKTDEYRYKGVDKSIQTKIKNGYIIPDHFLNEWDKYRKEVRKLTNRNIEELYNNWDGFDYYDYEYIKDNLNYDHTNRLYPTVDHKISILNGFNSGLSVEFISDINNLCITKRYHNSSKTFKNYDEYFNIIKKE